MYVLGTGNLGLDHAQVLGIRQALRLDGIWFSGCRHKSRGVLGAVIALRETFIGKALWEKDKRDHIKASPPQIHQLIRVMQPQVRGTSKSEGWH